MNSLESSPNELAIFSLDGVHLCTEVHKTHGITSFPHINYIFMKKINGYVGPQGPTYNLSHII